MWFLQKSGFAKNPQIHFYKYKTFLQIQNIFTNTKHFYKYKTFLQIQTRRKNGGMESIM